MTKMVTRGTLDNASIKNVSLKFCYLYVYLSSYTWKLLQTIIHRLCTENGVAYSSLHSVKFFILKMSTTDENFWHIPEQMVQKRILFMFFVNLNISKGVKSYITQPKFKFYDVICHRILISIGMFYCPFRWII